MVLTVVSPLSLPPMLIVLPLARVPAAGIAVVMASRAVVVVAVVAAVVVVVVVVVVVG